MFRKPSGDRSAARARRVRRWRRGELSRADLAALVTGVVFLCLMILMPSFLGNTVDEARSTPLPEMTTTTDVPSVSIKSINGAKGHPNGTAPHSSKRAAGTDQSGKSLPMTDQKTKKPVGACDAGDRSSCMEFDPKSVDEAIKQIRRMTPQRRTGDTSVTDPVQ